MRYFTVSAKGRKGYYFETKGYMYICDMNTVGEFTIHADNRQEAIRMCKLIASSHNPKDEITRQDILQQINIIDKKIKDTQLTQDQLLNINKQINRLIDKYDLNIVKREEFAQIEKHNDDSFTITQQKTIEPYHLNDLQDNTQKTESLPSNTRIEHIPYDIMNLSSKQWEKDITRHTNKYYELLDKDSLSSVDIESLASGDYCFWVKVVSENPYYYADSYLIDLYLQYINKPLTAYVKKKVIKFLAEVKNAV